MTETIVHVLPVNDLYPHTETGKYCACDPRIDEVEPGKFMVVHNSYDGREQHEQFEELHGQNVQ